MILHPFFFLSLQLTMLGSVVHHEGVGVSPHFTDGYTKLCLQISTLNSTSLLHTIPTLSCCSLWEWQSLLSPLVQLPSFQTHLQSLHPPRWLVSILVQVVSRDWSNEASLGSWSSSLDSRSRRGELFRQGNTYLNTSQQDWLTEGPNVNTSSPPLGNLVAKSKRLSSLKWLWPVWRV